MIPLTGQQIANAIGGEILQGDSSSLAVSVSTDSRKGLEDAVFFTLVGENFDAHDYLDSVLDSGVKVVVCEKFEQLASKSSAAIIKVSDTLLALQKLASYVRDQIDFKVVGVTGSNGKTSTKDFVKAVLSSSYSTSATAGNFNNHIGLPLTILSADIDDKAAVWEMGMNHPGEIAPLCEIARPHIGVITNVGTAHIEFMGSIDEIAKEKGALAESLTAEGTLIVPASCEYNDQFSSRTTAKMMEVGGMDSLIRAENLSTTIQGSKFDLVIGDEKISSVQLPVIGEHMVTNALLAAAVGHVFGLSIEVIAKALSQSELTSGRLRSYVSNGVQVIDDTYNANPESVKAALATLAEVESTGVRYVVLGKMGELGEHASAAYQILGEYAAELKLTLVSVGDEAISLTESAKKKVGAAHHFSETEEAAEWLKNHVRKDDVVLFKGSRAAAMEHVMNLAFTPI